MNEEAIAGVGPQPPLSPPPPQKKEYRYFYNDYICHCFALSNLFATCEISAKSYHQEIKIQGKQNESSTADMFWQIFPKLFIFKRANTKSDLVVTSDTFEEKKKWAERFSKAVKKNLGQVDA